MGREDEIVQLIQQANLSHSQGKIDDEIQFRLRAYSISEGLAKRPVEQIEKSAHLICDISDLLEDPSSDKEWKQLTRHADRRHGIIEGGIVELVNAQLPEHAFALTQRIKSPFLVRRLRSVSMQRPGMTQAAKDYRDQYDKKLEIQNGIRQAQRDGKPKEQIHPMLLQLEALGVNLKALEMRLREEDPEALASFAAPLLPDDLLPLLPADGRGCVVDLYFAGEIVILFAFRRGANVEIVAAIDPKTNLKMLAEHTEKWLSARFSGQMAEFEKETLNLGRFLHDRFVCSLGKFLVGRGHWQITVIPHLLTHIFPLHLAPLCETGFQEYFCDKFAVSYAPCIQLAVTTALRPRPVALIQGGLPAFLLADPVGNLPASHIEQKHVSENLRIHPWPAGPVTSETVLGPVDSVETVAVKLSNAGIGLISTHGTFKAGDPYGSGLYLATPDTKKPRLWTVDEMFTNMHLGKNPVVILSACESGMSYFDEQKEVVALPPAFVCAGAASVVSTFWPVEEVSASLVVERFVHHLMDPGEFPATALFSAFKDVRSMSRKRVLKYCDEILGDMEERGAHQGAGSQAYLRLTALSQRIQTGPEKPFESPVFWGGFFVTGCGWALIEGKGGITRKANGLMDLAMAVMEVKQSAALFKEKKYEECIRRIEEAMGHLDGLWLGRAMLILGDSIYRMSEHTVIFDALKSRQRLERALKFLDQAYDLLLAEGAEKEMISYCKSLAGTIRKDLKAMG
jgi:CHAT domain-containing protein